MNTKSLCITTLFLCVAATPAWARQPVQATSSTAPTPANRAAMQRELMQLEQRMDTLAKRMGKLSSQLALNTPNTTVYEYLANPDRGMLGMVVRADPADHGFRVSAVTPDGPAQKAGIRVGDVITGVNGKAVHLGSGSLNAWPLGNIKAGTTVRLGIAHAGHHRLVAVKATRLNTNGWPAVTFPAATSSALSAASTEFAKALALAGTTTHYTFDDLTPLLGRAFGPWWGLNLAPLNADLGSYFGTRNGALVLSTQSKRYPGLHAGDVITAVNGKAVARPEDVMRALRGQLQGMTVQLRVRRHGKAMTVSMKVRKATTKVSQRVSFSYTLPSQ